MSALASAVFVTVGLVLMLAGLAGVRAAFRRAGPRDGTIDVDRIVADDEMQVLRGYGPRPAHRLDAGTERRHRAHLFGDTDG